MVTPNSAEPLDGKIQVSYALTSENCKSFTEAWAYAKKNDAEIKSVVVKVINKIERAPAPV